ncbi:MAG: bifunctional UDP-3-O-[3-hydroxymyristoyl] N-acetylglucosamine deacetylase/3-hydroxyacyl-ACP dehydratase [Rikenellaceae bacterium]
MSDKQRTIASDLSFCGKGLHSGLNVNIVIKPAESNFGIKFQRVDIEDKPVIAALAENVVDTSRGTTIAKKDAKVSTIEHLMAALFGCGVDNALIEIDAPEVPIMDGSAREFVEKIEAIGTSEQDADRVYYEISSKLKYELKEKGIEIVAYPDDEWNCDVKIDFNSKIVGKQYASVSSIEDFVESKITSCRTFVFLHEIKPLIDNNLIKGGDLDNAIVIVENTPSAEELAKINEVFNRHDIKVENSGYLNNLELRFENEIARHKLLDLVGDLALIGRRIKGRIVATRPGHFANTEFAKMIQKAIKADSVKPKYKYDVNVAPVIDINGIRDILPHRPPFLLVDKIIHIDKDSVVGIKNVTMNEPFFVGHFPEEPVMPGVLSLEAMAQCGGILALSQVEEPKKYSTYFMKIDGVKFKRKIVPGDTIMFILELAEPIRRGIVLMNAKAFIGDSLAVEAVLMAQIAKNK